MLFFHLVFELNGLESANANTSRLQRQDLLIRWLFSSHRARRKYACNFIYCMSSKYWPIIYSYLLYKMSYYFLDTLYLDLARGMWSSTVCPRSLDPFFIAIQTGSRLLEHTVCPRSSDPFYILTYYIKRVTTSWTYSIEVVKLIENRGIWSSIFRYGFWGMGKEILSKGQKPEQDVGGGATSYTYSFPPAHAS